MKQARDFEDLEHLIEHLKAKPDILAIAQYGSRDYSDMSPGGDFDVNLVVKDTVPTRICGMHFHVKQVPVDCGIIKVGDLEKREVPSDFHCTLIDSQILFDRTGMVTELLSDARKNWKLKIKLMSESELAFERFIKQHVVDKFEGREYEDEVYTSIFLCGNIFWLLEDYMKLQKLNPYDFKGALSFMRTHSLDTYKLFERFINSADLAEKIYITKALNEAVFAEAGGAWKPDEVLFHYANFDDTYSDAEKQTALELIF